MHPHFGEVVAWWRSNDGNHFCFSLFFLLPALLSELVDIASTVLPSAGSERKLPPPGTQYLA
jgi:hypothetical protein